VRLRSAININQGEVLMAKAQTAGDFADQSTERALREGLEGFDWMRVMAEQSLNLSKAAFEGYLDATRKTADTFAHQAAEIRERSLSLANETLANTFDFANKAVRAKEPREAFRLHSEFLGRQAQTLADKTNELGQIIAHGASAASRTAAEQMQRAAE
jgi:hypothetical protein